MGRREQLTSLFVYLQDIIFPVYCLGCETEGEIVCPLCCMTLDCSGVFFCPLCHKEQRLGVCCAACKEKSHLSQVIGITPYNERTLTGKIIQMFKYKYVYDVERVFKWMTDQFLNDFQDIFCAVDCIVPVPLHRRRFVERGFNQAEKIAMHVALRLGKPIVQALKRIRHTPHQAVLTREERLYNIRDAFDVIAVTNVRNKYILLVDDVYTTGATMQECAKVLLGKGAKAVMGCTIARG